MREAQEDANGAMSLVLLDAVLEVTATAFLSCLSTHRQTNTSATLRPSLTSLFPPLSPLTLLLPLPLPPLYPLHAPPCVLCPIPLLAPTPHLSAPILFDLSPAAYTLVGIVSLAHATLACCVYGQLGIKMMREVWVYLWQLWIKMMRACTVVTPTVLEILPRAVAIVTVPKGPLFGLNGLSSLFPERRFSHISARFLNRVHRMYV